MTGASDETGSENTPESSSDTPEGLGPLLLVIPGKRPVEDVLDLALRWAAGTDRELALVRPVIAPRQTPLDAMGDEMEAERIALAALQEDARSMATDLGADVPVRSLVMAGHRMPDTIASAISDLTASEVLLPSLFPTGPDDLLSASDIEAVQDDIPCRSVAFREPRTSREIDSILAAVGAGPHSLDVVQVSDVLAEVLEAELHIAHVVDQGDLEDAEEFGEFAPSLGRYPPRSLTEAHVLEGTDVTETILEEARDHDALAIGAPSRSRLRHFLYGSRSRAAGSQAPGWTWTVHAPGE